MAVEKSVVHILGVNDAQVWGEGGRIIVHKSLKRQEFINLLSSMYLNLYVSYSESWGQGKASEMGKFSSFL